MSIDGLVVFLTIVSIVGTIGNLIVALVYWKKKDKQTSSFFILVLACSDWIVCSVLVPMTIYFESIMFLTQNVLLCKAFYFLTTTIVPSSCLLMTAIAFDRYFCICMVSKNVMNLYRAKIIVICLIVISCLLGVIPSLAAITVIDTSSQEFNHSITNTSTNLDSNVLSTTYQCTLVGEANSANSTYYSFVASLLHPFKYCYDLIFASTVIIITTLYILIYIEIYTRRKEKRKRKRQLLFSSWVNGGGKLFKTNNNKNNQKPNSNNEKVNKNTNNKVDQDQDNKIQIDKTIINRIDDVNDEGNLMETKFLTEECQLNKNDQTQVQNPILNTSIQTNSSVKRKRSVNVISTKDIRTAFMLFVISFLFICFFSPSLILTYISLLKIQTESNLILTYLYFSNSAINPIIYCFLNPNFRADLLKLFFKRGSIYNTCTKHFNNLK